MIDHALGRPDPKYRKYQLLAVLFAWSAIITLKPHGPFKSLSRFLSRRLTTWQVLVLAYMLEYVRRNFARIVGLVSPEPLANKYNRDYFRATWVTTALDAGFWTAMRLKPRWLREIASVVFTGYYLLAAEAADDKVRRVRGVIGVEHMRVSWNKGTTPIIAWFSALKRPKHLTIRYRPREVRIPRPKDSAYTEPIKVVLYYDGPLNELKNHDKIILDIPGGGFVAMNPRCHDDKLMAWAAKTGFPVIAIDYCKAPEYPYPYALNECFDAYWMIHTTGGSCVGLAGSSRPKIVLSGDSAGGNLAVSLVLMLVQARIEPPKPDRPKIPLPEAMVLIYPALDVNITSWLTDDQAALIEEPARRKYNQGLVRRQTEDYHRLANTPVPSEDELEGAGLKMTSLSRNSPPKIQTASPRKGTTVPRSQHVEAVVNGTTKKKEVATPKPRPLRTKLKTTSMISYVDDRILTPELLRGMIFLYVGENNCPDLSTDFFLSPLRAPESYLREFPKVYMLTGEKDPLCDDTAIFAGRLRTAHQHHFQTRQEMGIVPESEEFDDREHFEVEFIPGVSHGFLQFASVYAPAWDYMEMCSRWMKQAFAEATRRDKDGEESETGQDYFSRRHPHRSDSQSTENSDTEDLALEMTALNGVHVPRDERQNREYEWTKTNGTAGDESSGSKARKRRGSRGSVRKSYFDGRMSPVATRTGMDLRNLRLTTPESLLERRMDGVATGLMGDDSRPVTPS